MKLLRDSWQLTRDAVADFGEDKAGRLGAALAYYMVFSLAPLLVLAIGVAGLVFGEAAARGELLGKLDGLMGPQGASMVQTMIASTQKSGDGVVATVIGTALLLFGASGVFVQLQDALNEIWDVDTRAARGLMHSVRARLMSFGMVLVIGSLLLLTLVASAGISGFSEVLGRVLPIPVGVLQLVNLLLSFAMATLLFALIFKVLPDAVTAWRDVWVGAAVTALLFAIGKHLIGLYLGRAGVASAFGAAGSLIVLLLWIYYSSQIVLLGAEYTHAYAARFGSGVDLRERLVGEPRKPRPQHSPLD